MNYSRESLRWRATARLCPGGYDLVASWWPDEETWTARRGRGECVVGWPAGEVLDALEAQPGGAHLGRLRQWYPATGEGERVRRADALTIIAVTLEDAFGKKRGATMARRAAKKRGVESLEGLDLESLEGMASWFARTPGEVVREELGARYDAWSSAQRRLRGVVSKAAEVQGHLLGDEERAQLLEDAHEGIKIDHSVGSYHELGAEQLEGIIRDVERRGVSALLAAADVARDLRAATKTTDQTQAALI